jgi:hypothetical protein
LVHLIVEFYTNSITVSKALHGKHTEKNFFFNLNQINKMENINTSKYGLNQLNQDILFSPYMIAFHAKTFRTMKNMC